VASAYRAPPLHLRLWSRLFLIADSLELRPVALAAAAEPHLVNQENPAKYNAVVTASADGRHQEAGSGARGHGLNEERETHRMLGASRSLIVISRVAVSEIIASLVQTVEKLLYLAKWCRATVANVDDPIAVALQRSRPGFPKPSRQERRSHGLWSDI